MSSSKPSRPMSISFSKSNQEVSVKNVDEHELQDLSASKENLSKSSMSPKHTPVGTPNSNAPSPIAESLSIASTISSEAVLAPEVAEEAHEGSEAGLEDESPGAHPKNGNNNSAEESIVIAKPNVDRVEYSAQISAQSDLFSLTDLCWSYLSSPYYVAISIFLAYLCLKINGQYLFGFISAIVLVPAMLFLWLRYYIRQVDEAEARAESTAIERATKTGDELSGWLLLKEDGGKKKEVYLRLKGRELRLS